MTAGGLRDVLGEGVYVQMKQGVHFPGMRLKFCPTSYQTNTKQMVPLSLHLFSRTIVHWWLSRTSVFSNGSHFRMWGQNISTSTWTSVLDTDNCVSRRQHCCRVSLSTPTSIYFIRVHEQVPTLNSFLYSTRFSGSEIITNERLNALNTW